MEALIWLLTGMAKGTLFVAAAWVVSALPVWSAAQRHALLTGGILGQLVILAASPLLPPLPVPVPLVASASSEGVALAGGTGSGSAAARGPDVSRPGEAAPGEAPRPTGDPATIAGGPPTAPSRPGPGAGILLIAWAAGAAVLLARLAGSSAHARRWAAAGRPVHDPRWRRDLRRACADLSIDRSVRLVVRRGLAVPVSLGGRAPTIALPPDALSWPGTRRRSVLLHELAHLRRRDSATHRLCSATCALLWPNPVLWMARRAVAACAEQACDDLVLTAGVQPSRYVLELVAVARHARRSRAAPRARPGLAMVDGASLEARARALLDPDRSRASVGWGGGVAGLLVGGTAALVLGTASAATPNGLPGTEGATDFPYCEYEGGPLIDRYRPDATGIDRWAVSWVGEGCDARVEVGPVSRGRAVEAVTLGGAHGVRLEPLVSGTSVEIRVGVGDRLLHARLGRDREGRRTAALRIDGHARPFGPEAEEWLDRVSLQVEHLTAFAAARRFPELLAAGGSDAVLDEAARTRGGHAGGIYLTLLARSGALDAPTAERLLEMAAAKVRNEAVLVELLQAVDQTGTAREGPAAAGFEAARDRLRTRAGRDAVAGR